MFAIRKVSFIVFTLIFYFLNISTTLAAAEAEPSEVKAHKPINPIYVGLTLGWGATTWNALVGKGKDTQLKFYLPVSVKDGDIAWGVFVGYEFTRLFALEYQYMHFPNSIIRFDPRRSVYSHKYHHSDFETKSSVYSLHAKFMVPIYHTPIRAFASAGIAVLHRKDSLAYTKSGVGGDFGAGFNYNLNPHALVEIGFQFFTGKGITELEPVHDYIPFLYSFHLRFAYRFSF